MADARILGPELLATAGIEIGGTRPHDIVVHDDSMWERVIRDRELGLGETFQEGSWDANQLDEFLAVMQEHDVKSMVRPGPDLVWLAAKSTVQNRQTVRRARRNASAHYDIGNDLYERMLDKRMIYSCGYWREADDLDSAQEAKLDLVCRKLGLEQGMTVLDIGCGWGGFAQFAAERYDVRVTGISPAAEQVKVATQRCAGLPVDIRQTDYRHVGGRYDRIVSIGMMEHVGARNLRRFFGRCDQLLAPDGVMLHHTIGSNETKRHNDPWFDRYIFPAGVLPSLSQIARAAEKRWTIEDVHNFGPDYDRTLMAWHAAVSERWDEIPSYSEHFRRTWDYYLQGSAAAFRVRALQLWQIVFTRTRRRSEVYAAVR